MWMWIIAGIAGVGYLGYRILGRMGVNEIADNIAATRRAALAGNENCIKRWNNKLLPLGRELVARSMAGDDKADNLLIPLRLRGVFLPDGMDPILKGTVKISPSAPSRARRK